MPLSWNAPATDESNWPRLVQLAFLQVSEYGAERCRKSFLIKPSGFEIPAAATRVHGITTQTALEQGVELQTALNEFSQAISESTLLIAHNMRFDENVVASEFHRTQTKNKLHSIKKLCTMTETTGYCQIKNGRSFKWPSLVELHKKLFGKGFDGEHDALQDVLACTKCFFELKTRGVIEE